jgi:hypothetical protein
MNPLSFLDYLPSISWNKAREMRIDSFDRGYRLGKKEAIDFLRDVQKYDCKNLNEWERAIVMQFLDEYNLEFGYNFEKGGFYVLKRKKLW